MSDNNITVSAEFIKLARSLRQAQKDAVKAGHSEKARRRAQNIEQLFDAKLEAIEKEQARAQQFSEPAAFPERLL